MRDSILVKHLVIIDVVSGKYKKVVLINVWMCVTLGG